MSLTADLEMVGVGWSVWSATRRDHNDVPLGGPVCSIDHHDHVQPETGEIEHVVTFRCRDPYRGAPLNVITIDGSDVNLPAGAEPPERNRIYMIVRQLCRSVGKPTRSTWLTATDMDCVVDAYRLLMALEAR